MTKVELIAAVAEKAGFTKKDSKEFLNAFIDVVKDEVVAGGEVALSGFGTFTIVEKAARNGVNPKTGEALVIPAKKAPKFKVSKNFKDAVNA